MSSTRPFGRCAALCAVALLAAGSVLAAGVTFAQYNQVSGGAQQWTVSESSATGTPTTTISASGTVDFTFSGVPGSPIGPQVANFLLSATSTTDGYTNTNSVYSEAGFSGMFSFIDTSLPAGYQNLLSGIFQFPGTGAQFVDTIGGTGGYIAASDTASDLDEVVMTSSYINFIGQTLQTSVFTISSLAPSFNAGGTLDMPTGGPYYAAGVGTFSSNPGFVPEPGTFFLFGAGLAGGLGLARYRRKTREI